MCRDLQKIRFACKSLKNNRHFDIAGFKRVHMYRRSVMIIKNSDNMCSEEMCYCVLKIEDFV